MTNYKEAGGALMRSVMGEEFAGKMEAGAASEAFGSGVTNLAIEFAFGAVWSRPGLDLKTRSTIVITALIAQGQSQELANHVRFGINNGLTEHELHEILIQALPYVGFPAIASALKVMIEVLRERGMGGGAQTPQERGLL